MAIAIIDAAGLSQAVPFYRAFPKEPVRQSASSSDSFIVVDSMVGISDLSFERLCEEIIGTSERDVLIVAHGNEEGLSIPIMNGGNPGSQFSVQAARVFALWLADARSDDQVNDKLDLRASINELTRLKKSIKEVFNKNLGRVELRSCLVGLSKETLDVFKFVFGAASVSAPVVFDGYGRIDFGNFTSAASSWNDFRSRHPRRIQQGVSPNRVAVAVTRGQGLRVEFHGIAQSAKAVRGFVERNYTSSAAGGLTEPVALEAHAFIASNAAPMFPADAAYRNQLQIV